MHKNNNVRTCENCGLKEHKYLSIRELLHKESNIWRDPCPSCGGEKHSEYWVPPKITKESLDIWRTDKNAWFIGQDEESIFEQEHISLIFDCLDNKTTLISKKTVLIQLLTNMMPYNHLIKKKILSRINNLEKLKYSNKDCDDLLYLHYIFNYEYN